MALQAEKQQPCNETFEELISFLQSTPGSQYERARGLERRNVHGIKHTNTFGTITYTTDDGRVGFIWGLMVGVGWVFFYPDDETFIYFRDTAPAHIRAVLENNKTRPRLRYGMKYIKGGPPITETSGYRNIGGKICR